VPKKQPDHQFKVGGKIRINMHGGKIVDAIIKAILGTTNGLKNQVDYYRNSWDWRRVEETQLAIRARLALHCLPCRAGLRAIQAPPNETAALAPSMRALKSESKL
jgi:hypothetical protein